MKVAIIGSRTLSISTFADYLPTGTTEIISGGAKGIDTCAKEYAKANRIKLSEYLPEYEKYGKSAPLKRNITIIEHSDLVLAFWDGQSRGTKFVIDRCKRLSIPIKVFLFPTEVDDMYYPVAYFVKLPFRLADLLKPHFASDAKPYIIEKTVVLSAIDYKNFTTDLSVDRRFIEESSSLCYIDKKGVWHCIFVKCRSKTDGVLVMSCSKDFPLWAAYMRGAKKEPA